METFGQRYREAWRRWRAAHPKAPPEETAFVEAVGMKMSTASPYKNQIEAPIHSRVIAIARAAGVDPGWLAYGSLCQAPMEKDWIPDGVKRERPAIPANEALAAQAAKKRGKGGA